MAEKEVYLLCDNPEEPHKIAFFQDRSVVEIWCRAEGPELGEVHLARLVHFNNAQRRATATLQDGSKISWQTHRNQKLEIGQLVMVTLTAFGWQDKPLQASMGAQIAGHYGLLVIGAEKNSAIRFSKKQAEHPSARKLLEALQKTSLAEQLSAADASLIIRRRSIEKFGEALDEVAKQLLITALQEETENGLDIWKEQAHPVADLRGEAHPRQIFSGLPLIQQASLYADTKDIRIAHSQDFAQIHSDLTQIMSPKYVSNSGAVIWIEPTRAAIMIDIDSAQSGLSPAALASQTLPEIFYLLRLRGLAGRVLIDIPYLNGPERKKCEADIKALCKADPRQPEYSGFTPSGLVELRYRYGRQPLDKSLKSL